MSGRRVAVIGAGPAGLEAACALVDAGHDVTVFERGLIGEGVRSWGHVTLFSPWSLNQSARGRAARDALRLPPLDEAHCPSGAEYAEHYLTPLARAVSEKASLHERTLVVSISRDGALKGQHIGAADRSATPFRVLCDTVEGESVHFADIIIDATGTYGNATGLGPGGAPAVGERTTAGRVARTIPDVLGAHRARYAGQHTVIVGGGYSAATVLRDLAALRNEAPGTRVTWVLLSSETPYARLPDDPLPSRDQLCAFANALEDPEVAARHGVTLVRGGVVSLADAGEHLVTRVRTLNGALASIDADEIIALTGYKPNLEIYSELQVHSCYGTDGPMKLAAVLMASDGGGNADCLAQSSAGPDALTTPEPGFFVLGSKSYGRRSSYLLKLGIEQVDELMVLLSRT
ncbi:MAG: hypothetical protein ACI81R_003238 [Bradymonadia bacterium]